MTMQDIKLCENWNILAKVNAISVHLPFVTPNNHINWTLTAPAGCHDFVVHWGPMLQRGEEKGRATEDLVFENTLSSHLSSSQRKTCRCNVVVKCAVEILIREKWVGCSPSGWLQPCWLSVGEKTLCMKVGLLRRWRINMKLMYCHKSIWHLCGFTFLALPDFICFVFCLFFCWHFNGW